jgi:hypothetical protein
MGFEFTKATKSKAKLRAAFFGPSGSGKTFTALRVAKGMADVLGSRVAVIDTERHSASKYADRFDFDALDLENHDIDTYVAAMEAAAEQGYQVLVIDSLTHAWQELLEEVDHLASTRFKGNSHMAWSHGTPKQKRLINAILTYPGHLIVTMRAKTEWATEQDSRGKNKPVRVGLAPEQRKGMEYEFDFLMEINTEHVGTVIKDRSGRWQDQAIECPGEDFGSDMVNWLDDGKELPPPPPTRADVIAAVGKWAGVSDKADVSAACKKVFDAAGTKDYAELMAWIGERSGNDFSVMFADPEPENDGVPL